MVDILYNAINNYYSTLTKTGYLPEKVTENLIVLNFMQELIDDPNFPFFATECDKSILYRLYDCVVENNCLIGL